MICRSVSRLLARPVGRSVGRSARWSAGRQSRSSRPESQLIVCPLHRRRLRGAASRRRATKVLTVLTFRARSVLGLAITITEGVHTGPCSFNITSADQNFRDFLQISRRTLPQRSLKREQWRSHRILRRGDSFGITSESLTRSQSPRLKSIWRYLYE